MLRREFVGFAAAVVSLLFFHPGVAWSLTETIPGRFASVLAIFVLSNHRLPEGLAAMLLWVVAWGIGKRATRLAWGKHFVTPEARFEQSLEVASVQPTGDTPITNIIKAVGAASRQLH